ncbi:MAG: L-rhamnose isomerase, partial [Erysipelotrichaceae bacterium]|nr:L-rhamnose isomerase [Erysipelotrichaceae bacterium]
WVTGYRNTQKALLYALLQPVEEQKALQDEQKFSKLLNLQEEFKTMPFEDVWNEYCTRCEKPLDDEWFAEVERYEEEVLSKR